jgi:hypothetical protein
LLQFWEPRTAKFEEVVFSSTLFPFLFRKHDPYAERIAVSIMAAIDRYEAFQGFSSETLANILIDGALRQDLEEHQEDTEKWTDLIRDALQDGRDEAFQNQLDTIKLNLAGVSSYVESKRREKRIRTFVQKWTVPPIVVGVLILFVEPRIPQLIIIRTILAILWFLSLTIWLWFLDKRGLTTQLLEDWPYLIGIRNFRVWLWGPLGAIVVSVIAKLVASLFLS